MRQISGIRCIKPLASYLLNSALEQIPLLPFKNDFMKKAIFVSMVCLLSTITFAQNFSAGVKAGVNITNFTGGDFKSVDKKAMVGFHAGGFLSFALGVLYLQPEALIS